MAAERNRTLNHALIATKQPERWLTSLQREQLPALGYVE